MYIVSDPVDREGKSIVNEFNFKYRVKPGPKSLYRAPIALLKEPEISRWKKYRFMQRQRLCQAPD